MNSFVPSSENCLEIMKAIEPGNNMFERFPFAKLVKEDGNKLQYKGLGESKEYQRPVDININIEISGAVANICT
ncbi:hypothetical protein BTA51_23475 [Hahella sp. CCB-MM4]|nr:hypothetical protein BTA51_23475 [Hahella sp. CCB-MM4]